MGRTKFAETAQYARAIGAALNQGSEKHRELLQAHFEAPRHTRTYAQLAKDIGYANYGAVNLQYGILAHRVAETLGIFALPSRGFWGAVLVDWAGGFDPSGTQFRLRPEVVEALESIGFGRAPTGHSNRKRADVVDQSGLTDYCVYTIVDGKRLARLAKEGRSSQFDEGKPWATASKLWQEAQLAGRAMPLLFGDAAHCSRLLYWGLLTDVHIVEGITHFAVDRVRKLGGRHTPQELVLRSSGRQIAPGFIRPYALCETPAFVNSEPRGLTRAAPDGRRAIMSGRG